MGFSHELLDLSSCLVLTSLAIRSPIHKQTMISYRVSCPPINRWWFHLDFCKAMMAKFWEVFLPHTKIFVRASKEVPGVFVSLGRVWNIAQLVREEEGVRGVRGGEGLMKGSAKQENIACWLSKDFNLWTINSLYYHINTYLSPPEGVASRSCPRLPSRCSL